MELEAKDVRLEEKKKRSAELLQEVALPLQNAGSFKSSLAQSLPNNEP